MVLDKNEFLSKYSISDEAFEKTEIEWSELEAIYTDHENNIEKLRDLGEIIFKDLMKAPKVHSVRFRVKDPEHLVEKIIRKRIENPDRIITQSNYTEELKDIVGVRVIHLFKEDFLEIYDYVKDTYEMIETPKGYYRKGDSEEFVESLKSLGLEALEHNNGYRSIHYVTKIEINKRLKSFVEIQVRTIFEEAWSEIDHTVNYPKSDVSIILINFLQVLNRLSGSADEMGTVIKQLSINSANEKKIKEKLERERDEAYDSLDKKIEELVENETDMKALQDELKEIKNKERSRYTFDWEKEFVTPIGLSSIFKSVVSKDFGESKINQIDISPRASDLFNKGKISIAPPNPNWKDITNNEDK